MIIIVYIHPFGDVGTTVWNFDESFKWYISYFLLILIYNVHTNMCVWYDVTFIFPHTNTQNNNKKYTLTWKQKKQMKEPVHCIDRSKVCSERVDRMNIKQLPTLNFSTMFSFLLSTCWLLFPYFYILTFMQSLSDAKCFS